MKLLKGFTLVELLVVMAIISFLSVGAFAGLSYGLRQSRDVQKKKLVDLAHTAIQAYYSDNARYPKGADGNDCPGTTFTATPSGNIWRYCSGAFPRTDGTVSSQGYLIKQGGTGGVKDYLEGEWPTSNNNADPGASDQFIRYYYSSGTTTGGSALKFAVCTTLENKTSNQNLTRAGSGGVKDCYCAGTEYSEVSCNGLQGR